MSERVDKQIESSLKSSGFDDKFATAAGDIAYEFSSDLTEKLKKLLADTKKETVKELEEIIQKEIIGSIRRWGYVTLGVCGITGTILGIFIALL